MTDKAKGEWYGYIWPNDRILVKYRKKEFDKVSMEQHALENVNSGLNTITYAYLETSVGQSYNL